MKSDADITQSSAGKYVTETYACLGTTGILSLAFVVIEVLHSARLMTDSYQGWITIIGMWFGLPWLILVGISVVLSFVAIYYGPKRHRLRIVGLWLIVGAGAFLYQLFADLDISGGSSTRAFGISDVVLLATAVIGSFLPFAWLRQK